MRIKFTTLENQKVLKTEKFSIKDIFKYQFCHYKSNQIDVSHDCIIMYHWNSSEYFLLFDLDFSTLYAYPADYLNSRKIIIETVYTDVLLRFFPFSSSDIGNNIYFNNKTNTRVNSIMNINMKDEKNKNCFFQLLDGKNNWSNLVPTNNFVLCLGESGILIFSNNRVIYSSLEDYDKIQLNNKKMEDFYLRKCVLNLKVIKEIHLN